MSIRRHIGIIFVFDLALLALGCWLLTTTPARRAIDRARGWASVAQVCWSVARRIGEWAMDAELAYHREIEKVQL